MNKPCDCLLAAVVWMALILSALPVAAKLRIHGELPEKPQFLQELLAVDLNKHTPFADTNREWISAVAEVVRHAQASSSWYGWLYQRLYSSAAAPPQHPATYHFSTIDARDVLRPLLKRTHGLHLDEETIHLLFNDGDMGLPSSYHSDNDKEREGILHKMETKSQVYEAAQRLQKITNGGLLLSIGQTPAYLTEMMRALEETKATSTGTDILEIPISGRPDTVREPHDSRHKAYNYDNLITPDREAFFRQILTDRGFYPKRFRPGDRVYLLDVSKGPSIAHLLLFTARWFQAEDIVLPDITLVLLKKQADVRRPENVTCGYSCLKVHALPELLDLEISDDLRIDIDIEFLDMDKYTVKTFDSLEGNLRVVAPFNAIDWTKRYNMVLSSYPTPTAQKMLEEYRSYALGRIVSEQQGAIDEVRGEEL